ncbi:MAG: hypothetical protein E6G84_04650 [Alphaproteobacteria bacterium]|nr:MAG: hypothetical protein E6G88_08595 [Alphaproteobacteria bacterium]TMJ53432.1 MAG: hypothetical protein E6G84_04650 [Alphaproteobacteria bacterium]
MNHKSCLGDSRARYIPARAGSRCGSSCPALVPGIHDFGSMSQAVDSRDKPGHDELKVRITRRRARESA